jgi:hypothetical protein
MTRQTSKGALARRAPLGIASIFPTDNDFEHIEFQRKIKIVRRRSGVSIPTVNLFSESSGLHSPGNVAPRMLSGAPFGASSLGIACPRAFRCQLALIVRCVLDTGEARLPIRVALRDSLALLERNAFKPVEFGRLSPRTDANFVTESGHDRTAFRL